MNIVDRAKLEQDLMDELMWSMDERSARRKVDKIIELLVRHGLITGD